jgi:hypothetical protein
MRFPFKRLLCDLEFHDRRFTEMGSFETVEFGERSRQIAWKKSFFSGLLFLRSW